MLRTLISNPFYKFLVLLILIYGIFGATSLYQSEPKIDEYYNHLPVLVGMYEIGFLQYVFSNEYKTANTPLPYLPALLVSKVINLKPSLLLARSLNIIISFLTVLLFIKIFESLNGSLNYSILIFVFYPYLIKTSFTFYVSIYGIFFLLLSIFFITKSIKSKYLLAGFSAAFGILSQQFIIAFPPSILFSGILTKKNSKKELKAGKYILFLTPLVIPLVLFISWGGITHQNWSFHSPILDPTHFTAIFTIIGSVFLPFTIDKIKLEFSNSIIVLFSLALMLTIFFSPLWADRGWIGQVTGYTYNFLTKIEIYSLLLSKFIQVMLCFSGLYLFYRFLTTHKNYIELILFVTSVFFVIVFSFNTVFSERHLLPLVTLLFLLTIPRMQHKWLLNLWILFQIILGTYYYYYWLFFNPNFTQ